MSLEFSGNRCSVLKFLKSGTRSQQLYAVLCVRPLSEAVWNVSLCSKHFVLLFCCVCKELSQHKYCYSAKPTGLEQNETDPKQASKGFTWYNVSHAIRFPTWWLSPFPYFAPVVISYLLKHLEIHMDSLHLSHELCCCFEFDTPPHHLWQDKSRNKQSHKMRFTNSIKITEVCLTRLARNVRSALACFGCATFHESFHHCWQLIEMVILFLFKCL